MSTKRKLPQKRFKPSRAKGLSLAELLVTMLLVAITVMGLMRLQNTLVYSAVDNAQRSIGIFLGNEMLDRIRVNSAGIATYEQQLDAVDCGGNEPASCGAGDNCTAANVSTRDVWEVICGSAAAGVNNLAMDLQCNGNCAMKNRATLIVSWQDKAEAVNSANINNQIRLSARL